MEEKYILAKWLNNDLSKEEAAQFDLDPNKEMYEKIKQHSASLQTTDFDQEALFEKIMSTKKPKNKTFRIQPYWLVKVAAVLVISLGCYFLVQNFSSETQVALNGKQNTFLLPDQSQVVLNDQSTIQFSKWNWANNRKLTLSGEAYFKVAKGQKFEVETALGKVAVLGTQFNVKVRNTQFEISCFEGRVQVSYGDTTILLTHGQTVSFHNGLPINDTTAISQPNWMEDKMCFDNENLDRIIDEIEQQYKVSILLKNTPKKELFTGKIPANNLDVAIQIIAKTYQLEINKTVPNTIIFQGK